MMMDSNISSSNDEDSDDEDEGTNVEGAKMQEEATETEDQGNEEVKDTNADLDGRDKVMTDVEDTHVTLTPVNPDGQQQSSSVSSGFVSSMLNPNQDTGVDDIFRQHTEATSLIDTNEAVDVAVQLKYERIREESSTANQQFLESIDDGMKKIIKEQVKKEVSKIIPKVESRNRYLSRRTDIQRQLYKALVEAYEADKILLDTYGDTVTIKRPRDGADDDEEPSAGINDGVQKKKVRKGTPASTSAPIGEAMHSTDVFKGPADQEFETGVQDEQAEEEVQHPSDWFQKPTRLPSPDHAWNTSVPAVHESVQPWLSNLAQQDPRESFDELTDSTFDFSAFVLETG
ncbi:hypothetical protein Tco_0005454 [Tanacetum coccineum]